MAKNVSRQVREVAACLQRWGAHTVYLFGSAARGTMREDSDVDIAVKGLPDQVFFAAMAEASRLMGRHVDLVSLDKDTEVTRELLSSGDLVHVSP